MSLVSLCYPQEKYFPKYDHSVLLSKMCVLNVVVLVFCAMAFTGYGVFPMNLFVSQFSTSPIYLLLCDDSQPFSGYFSLAYIFRISFYNFVCVNFPVVSLFVLRIKTSMSSASVVLHVVPR